MDDGRTDDASKKQMRVDVDDTRSAGMRCDWPDPATDSWSGESKKDRDPCDPLYDDNGNSTTSININRNGRVRLVYQHYLCQEQPCLPLLENFTLDLISLS